MRRLLPGLSLLLTAAGCAGAPPKPAIEHGTPTEFNLPTGSIAVAPLTVELPPREGIGTFYRNVDCWVRVRSTLPSDMPPGEAITSQVVASLDAAKLKAVAVASADPSSLGNADYVLTGSVPSAHADLCIDSFFNQGPAEVDAQVAISWHLSSVRDHRVVFETTTTGTARATDAAQTITAGVLAAAADATGQLVATAAVQQYLTYGHVVMPQAAATAAPEAAPVPVGGAAPIPKPPSGFKPLPQSYPPLLVPVRAARGGNAAPDFATARAGTVALAGGGAAASLGEGYLLTAAGNLGDGDRVTLGGAVAGTATVLRRNDETGVALLKLDGGSVPGLPAKPRHNRAGDALIGIGEAGFVSGLISGTRESGGNDTASLPGALAGGPLLDANGNMIGILLPGGRFASLGTAFRALQLGAQPSEE